MWPHSTPRDRDLNKFESILPWDTLTQVTDLIWYWEDNFQRLFSISFYVKIRAHCGPILHPWVMIWTNLNLFKFLTIPSCFSHNFIIMPHYWWTFWSISLFIPQKSLLFFTVPIALSIARFLACNRISYYLDKDKDLDVK